MKRLLCIAMLLLPTQSFAQPEIVSLNSPIVADVSHSNVQIHSSFVGTQLLIFGARNAPGDLVIAVRGPESKVFLRRKERIAGMWMHVERHKYFALPLFYALTSSRPLKDIAPPHLLHELGLGVGQVTRAANATPSPVFDKALHELMASHDAWQEPFGKISYFGESLFKVRLNVPDTLPQGAYSIEVYLFNKGKLAGFQTIPLAAYKVGMDADIYDHAQHAPWRYGILCVGLALLGGWLAHRLFHRS